MKQCQSNTGQDGRLTAITVVRLGTDYVLCPFFGKCDGLLVIDTKGEKTAFVSNDTHKPQSLCDLIVCSGATRLICGFIPEGERNRLRVAEIDVRLGSCARPVDELVSAFDQLAQA